VAVLFRTGRGLHRHRCLDRRHPSSRARCVQITRRPDERSLSPEGRQHNCPSGDIIVVCLVDDFAVEIYCLRGLQHFSPLTRLAIKTVDLPGALVESRRSSASGVHLIASNFGPARPASFGSRVRWMGPPCTDSSNPP
jgi:hypothetical protein